MVFTPHELKKICVHRYNQIEELSDNMKNIVESRLIFGLTHS